MAIFKKAFVAAILARFDVTDVGDEFDLAVGNGLEHFRQFSPFVVGIGRVADDGKAPDICLGLGHRADEEQRPFQFWPFFPVDRGNGPGALQRSRPFRA